MNKQDLSNLINRSEEKLQALATIQYEGLPNQVNELKRIFKEFKDGGNKLLSGNDILQIGIVGQVKAGKSSFLNSLFFNGEDILPKASTPMTAGLTVIEYSDENVFEIEYFTYEDWEIFDQQNRDYELIAAECRSKDPDNQFIQKQIDSLTTDSQRSAHEMIQSCTSKAKAKIGAKNDITPFKGLNELQNVLEKYVGASGEYTSVVKSLYIKMQDDRLKGLRIVDTPGVNDPVVSREDRTRSFLRTCHGVFLLSASSDFLGTGDIQFLNTRIGSQGIGTVVLLASKFDSVLQDLGAERVMKGEQPQDLGEVQKSQIRKFKGRLRELSSSIDEKLRGNIPLDATAGIGFSIAHKDPSQWDDVERTVVSQMKRYYPDYFSTEEDLKETFLELANMTSIKEDYLDKVFLENKESILQEKITGYFSKNREEISSELSRILDAYSNKRNLLQKASIDEIEKQKKNQKSLFENLKGQFNHLFTDFSRALQERVKSMKNNIRFQMLSSIPTEETEGTICVKGVLWGHNNEEIPYQQVDCTTLKENMKKAVITYIDSWNEQWKKMFDEAKSNLQDKLLAAITSFEKDNYSFDDLYYRNLLDNVLSEIRTYKELPIYEMIKTHTRKAEDYSKNQFVLPDVKDEKLQSACETVRKSFATHLELMIKNFRAMEDALVEDIHTEVQNQLDSVQPIINQLQTDFASKLEKEGEAYLENLEKELSEKTSAMKKIDNIIDNLKAMSNLYK